MTGNDGLNDEDTYIICGQANLWKSPNASNELGLYLNRLLNNYRYHNASSAGIMINGRPSMDTQYINRLRNVGILVDDQDRVIQRPGSADKKKFKASYRKSQEAASAVSKKGTVGQSFVTAMAPASATSTTTTASGASTASNGHPAPCKASSSMKTPTAAAAYRIWSS